MSGARQDRPASLRVRRQSLASSASYLYLVLLFASTLAGTGCAVNQGTFVSQDAPVQETREEGREKRDESQGELLSPLAPRPSCPFLIVVDGAGNFQGASRALRGSVAAEGNLIGLETFEWSHGFYRIVADQVHFNHARAQGRRLAEHILEVRRRWPDRPLYLFGHSAG